MKLVIGAALAAVALGALGSVTAQDAQEVVVTGRKAVAPGTEVQSKTVSYADLDLSKSAGLTTLASRIRGAASDVCAPQPQNSDVAGSTDYKKCLSHAVNMAVKTVNKPGLSAMVSGAGH